MEGQEVALRAPSVDHHMMRPQREKDDVCRTSPVALAEQNTLVNRTPLLRKGSAKKRSFRNSSVMVIILDEEKDMNDDEKTVSITCQRCGRCCKEEWWLWEGYASIQDVAGWIATRRYDILDWVDPIVNPITHELVFDIWISPRTHHGVDRCPWFRKRKGVDLYGCLIHDVKPIACKEWPSDIKEAGKVGCPACQDIFPCKTGQVIEFSKKQPDES